MTMYSLENIPIAILAGGLATRLRPKTMRIPKALIEVAGRPFIDHQLDLLYRKGFRRVVICSGFLGKLIENHVGKGARLGLNVVYSSDGGQLLGTGGAIRKASPLLGELFAVLYGDSYLDIDYSAVLSFFRARSELGLMTVFRNENRWGRSNVEFENHQILTYDKGSPTPSMRHIDYGLGFFRRPALEQLPAQDPVDLEDLYWNLIESNSLVGFESHQRFYEMGSPEGLAEMETLLSQVDSHHDSKGA